MRNFFSMLRNRDPGQGMLKVCRGPGITPPHEQALKRAAETPYGNSAPIFIISG